MVNNRVSETNLVNEYPFEYKTISFIIATIGRDSIKKTLSSIETWPGDEVLVIQFEPEFRKGWGGQERTVGIAKASDDYLAFIDDDDYYLSGHRQIMHQAILENKKNHPILFRMKYPLGRVIWDDPKLRCGNVGTPMIFIPNQKEMIPPWGDRYHADFDFVNCFGWQARKIIWRPEIIVQLGHEDERWWKYQKID